MARSAQALNDTTPLGDPELLLHHAEEAARQLGRAGLAAQIANRAHIHGRHGRRQPGQGEDFWEFRDHQPGDAAERIDWRRSAKSDHLYIREREWDTAQSLYLWIDLSPSMDFTSGRQPTKLQRAAHLGVTLAALFAQNGERVALLDGMSQPRAGRFGLRHIVDRLCRLTTLSGHASLPMERSPLPSGSHLLLLSDFLDPLDKLTPQLNALTPLGAACHPIQILDPAEDEFPYKGRVVFAGTEGEAEQLLGRAEDIATTYRMRFRAHNKALEDYCRQLGWRLLRHHTDHATHPCLMAAAAQLAGGLMSR